MSYLGAVMTLPGIAGFILTIGMGVDSNVLIFERIREELRPRRARGRRSPPASTACSSRSSTRTSRRSSRRRSSSSSAPGPIRGFATTLFFGLIANVFTAVFVSRTLFEFILSRRPAGATQLSI